MMRNSTARFALAALSFAAFSLRAAVHYVDVNGAAPAPPYTSWPTAATNIQDAIDAAVPGDSILVSNGVCRTGGRVVNGTLTNRVAVTLAVTVQSVNGPAFTSIEGYQVPGTTNGDSAVRCIYLTNGAALIGFTLTNGATRFLPFTSDSEGGGVWCKGVDSVLSNCVLVACHAPNAGGAYRGTLNNCVLRNNSANAYNCIGGGGESNILNSCFLSENSASLGGGVYGSMLYQCTLSNNSASYQAGGAEISLLDHCLVISNSVDGDPGNALVFGGARGILNNCRVIGNRAAREAGGAAGSLNNCLIVGNWSGVNCGGAEGHATNCTIVGNFAASTGGGFYNGTLFNSIVYYNTAGRFPDSGNFPNNQFLIDFTGCCTTPLPVQSSGNITNEPLFVDPINGDFHLQSTSPCINSGINAAAINATDLDGNPRIAGGTVDIGAYEFQSPASTLSYAWLQQYGLPTDGSADFSDGDADGMNNWQEWRAGTIPTDTSSVLKMFAPSNTVPGVVVSWQSVDNRNYFLQRAGNLAASPAFSVLQSNLAGQAGTTSYTDTNTAGSPMFFYRVGVQ